MINIHNKANPTLVYHFIAVFFIYIVFLSAIILTSIDYGWDTRVYCDAVDACNAGKNPYITRNLDGTYLPFSYQPVYLDVLKVPCSYRTIYEKYYPLLYLLILLCISYFLQKTNNSQETLLTYAIFLAGFGGFQWNVLTGNIEIFIFILLAAAISLLKSNKVGAAAFFIGVLSAWKLFPILFLLPFSLYPASLKRRIIILLSGISGFILIFSLSWLLHSDLIGYFWDSITGGIEGQHSTMHQFEERGYNTSLLVLINNILVRFFNTKTWLPSILVYLSIVISTLTPIYIMTKRALAKNISNKQNFMMLFSLWLLVILSLMPRLMSYTYILATLPLCLLLCSTNLFSIRIKSIFLLIACTPSISVYFLTNDLFLLEYIQTLCLYTLTVFLLVLLYKQYLPYSFYFNSRKKADI